MQLTIGIADMDTTQEELPPLPFTNERDFDRLFIRNKELTDYGKQCIATLKAENKRLQQHLIEISDNYAKIVGEILKCDPISAQYRADDQMEPPWEVIARVRIERDRLVALEWQIEHEGCAVSHKHERTYECRVEHPCGLCRLRNRASAAQSQAAALQAELSYYIADGLPEYQRLGKALRDRAELAESQAAAMAGLLEEIKGALWAAYYADEIKKIDAALATWKGKT